MWTNLLCHTRQTQELAFLFCPLGTNFMLYCIGSVNLQLKSSAHDIASCLTGHQDLSCSSQEASNKVAIHMFHWLVTGFVQLQLKFRKRQYTRD